MNGSTHTNATDRESIVHFLARESELILKWVLGLSLVATVVMLMSFFVLAWIPAGVAFCAYIGLTISREVERHEERKGGGLAEVTHPEEIPVAEHAEVMERAAEPMNEEEKSLMKREGLTIFLILSGIGVAAIAVALIVLQVSLQWLLIAGFFVFCYMLLIAAPLWLGWIEDDIDDVKQARESDLQEA
jgi:membrane protein implicated in regulation of membrane protease activity